MCANLMVFYKGALDYETLMWMPIPEVLRLNEYAERMLSAQKKELEKNGR